jgi:aryl-alcohol dehydrogenase-like predicted oxidoreductase
VWRYGWGPQDDGESIRTIRRALDLGVNWIDTAAAYGLGHSEEVVGKAISGMQRRPFIATKCGIFQDSDGSVRGNLKKESVKREAEKSLKRLGIEAIDLYQIHWPDPEKDIEEAWDAISALIKEGKVRYGGVSNFGIKELERIESIHPVASLQPPYSMFNRSIEKDIIPYCGRKNIGIICYSPMYKGFLTGKISKEWMAQLAPGDHRHHDPHFREPELSINIAFVGQLEQIAKKTGIAIPHLAIAWTLRHHEVTAAIVGARHPSQIEETLSAWAVNLSGDIVSEIDRLIEEREKKLDYHKNL